MVSNEFYSAGKAIIFVFINMKSMSNHLASPSSISKRASVKAVSKAHSCRVAVLTHWKRSHIAGNIIPERPQHMISSSYQTSWPPHCNRRKILFRDRVRLRSKLTDSERSRNDCACPASQTSGPASQWGNKESAPPSASNLSASGASGTAYPSS